MTKQFYEAVPGNARASQAAFDRQVYKLGETLLSIDSIIHDYAKSGNQITGIRFKGPNTYGADWMVIITAVFDEKYVVAFVFGDSIAVCMKTLVNKIRNGGLKWKDDQYAKKDG